MQVWEDVVFSNVVLVVRVLVLCLRGWLGGALTAAYGYADGEAQDLVDLLTAAPAGQMYSSASDMAKFMQLFFRDNVTADGAGQVGLRLSVRVDMCSQHCLAWSEFGWGTGLWGG